MKTKFLLVLVLGFLLVGCSNIVESLQTGNIKDSVGIAKDMNKEDINKKYNNQYPLIVALKKGQYQVAKILLNKGANANVNDGNFSALDIFILKQINSGAKKDNISSLLIEKGAKLRNYQQIILKIVNNERMDYIDMVISHFPKYKTYLTNKILNSNKVSLITDAINKKLFTNAQINVDKLLKEYNSKLASTLYNNYPKFERTIFLYAVKNNDIALVEDFFENKYNMTTKELSYIDKQNNLSNNILLLILDHSKYLSNTKEYQMILNMLKNNAIKNSNSKLLINCINKKVKINRKDINKIFNTFKDKNTLKIVYNKYPKYRKEIFLLELQKKNDFFIVYALNNKFRIDKSLLQRIVKLPLKSEIINTILSHSKYLSNTKEYKELSLGLKKKKIIQKWNKFVKKLSSYKSAMKLVNGSKYTLNSLSNQKIDINIRKRAHNIEKVMDKIQIFVDENKPKKIKKLRKMLIDKVFTIDDYLTQKSGPCFFGICAGFNKVTANVDIKLIDILDFDYSRFKIVNEDIRRASTSNWQVTQNLLNSMHEKYSIGKTMKKATVVAINTYMWKIHTSGIKHGYSKKDLNFIGIYMMNALADADSRDTGTWLIFDNMSCDAGIFANRLLNAMNNKSVYNDSYLKMIKKCGWDTIK